MVLDGVTPKYDGVTTCKLEYGGWSKSTNHHYT